MSTPLPSGWTEHKAPSGIPYYWNAELKKSTYKRPVAEEAAQKVIAPVRESAEQISERKRVSREERKKLFDRPKSKIRIPDCEPWVLVTTKRKRTFVHNTETKVSLWTAPKQVQEKIDLMKNKKEARSTIAIEERARVSEDENSPAEEEESENDVLEDELEEEDLSSDGEPVEFGFDEEDIAYQLNDIVPETNEPELSKEEAISIFKRLLSENHIDPYHPWDLVYPKLVGDERYRVLSSGDERQEVFNEYCKEAIAKKAKHKPKSAIQKFFDFILTLPQNMYWVEVKRKYRKEPTLKVAGRSDRELERIYREFQLCRKRSSEQRMSDFFKLCRVNNVQLPTTEDELPSTILNDVRYASLMPEERKQCLQPS
ncbi:DNA replication protein Dre4 [Schizosaccharomyces japonicus yFS275]|uniref:DNA replication protein Dre4 n=1 Tax=Schizosaccharomyces japonicus (strain yFS275 / FY16936) TaxID=402676 RepID=B6JWN1_SCHJY|nr:DNA replication protein Dre4 [Schizosaccharomyces japonicus yFS275]EEB05782.1 DNA replication protein Dre4 [Schizosaccharomyces japonicus yFS275]